jgi:NADH:ubiquinone oxidoreductase subunit F (NADH-binding)
MTTMTTRDELRTAVPQGSRRLFAAASPSYVDHLFTFGDRPVAAVEPLVAELQAAGLTGRGGAGFPVHRKLAAVAARRGRRGAPVVVGNGSEGERLSGKDKTLLRSAPHLVIDGLLVCADALGAEEARLVVDESVQDAVVTALAQRTDAARVVVSAAAGGFIGGEASAVVAAVQGRRPVPTDRRVRLAEQGVRRAPTLLQNVETLAHIALVARYGAEWFRQVGTHEDPGTRLVTVSAGTGPLRVFEAPGGIPIRMLLQGAGIPPVTAVLVGGFHGAWIPAHAVDTAFDPSGTELGASPGAGIVHALVPGECGLRATGGILDELAAASARQCGPCLNGLPRIAELFRDLIAGRDTRGELARIAGLVEGRGACHHPDGTVRLLRSALTAFELDAVAHEHGGCLARQGVAA